MVIRRVGPLSVAKIAGTLYAAIGLFVGAIFSLISVAGGFASNTSEGAGIAAVMGVGAIVFFPLLYGGMGFIATLIMAWLYNIIAGAVGGVELDVQ
jgi:hypothetical protein